MANRDQTIKKLESLVAAARSSSELDRVEVLAEQIKRRQLARDPESIVLPTSSLALRSGRSLEEIELPARHAIIRRRFNAQ